MASELLRGAAPYSPRGRMEAPSDWALSTYRMGGARPQLTFPIDTLYSVLCISGDQASLVADASRLAWRILATPQSKRIINIMLQKGPIEELRCNPAGSRDSDYLSLFQAAKIDPEIDAHVNEWLGESDTAIVIEMDSRRRPSREGDIALLAHMGFRTGNAQQEAQEVQEAHEAPHEPDLVMPVGSASAFDDPVAPYWARVSPSAFKEIHLRAEVCQGHAVLPNIVNPLTFIRFCATLYPATTPITPTWWSG